MATDYLNALGASGSGLNIRELTKSLVEADTAVKRSAAQKKIAATEVSVSALGKVRAQFQSLSGALATIGQSSVLKATSSNPAVAISVTDKSLVATQRTEIEVLQIAQRQVLEFGGFTSADAVLGSGSVSVDFGVWFAPEGEEAATSFAQNPALAASSIAVGTGATLQDLATALTSIPGVTARVLDKGDGTFSLGVVSEPGAGNALRFTVTESVPGNGLARFDTTASNLTAQVQEAKDAVLSVDGIIVARSSNEITDLIPGATLALSGKTTDPATLSVSRDTQLAEAAMTYMVEELNATMKLLGELTRRSTDGSGSGELAGDRVVETLKRQVTALIGQPLTGHGEKPVYLSQLGVSTNRDGSLSFNASAFQKAFEKTPQIFDAMFTDSLTAITPGASIAGKAASSAASGDYIFRLDPVTGEATVGGGATLALPGANGASQYLVLSGGLAGVMVSVESGVTDATLRFGRSFATQLQALLDTAAGQNGAISEREGQIGKVAEEQAKVIEALDARAAKLESRYLAQFTAMEQAVSRMKSTGTYLENLISAWNKD
ncbi:flagellar filament capping protein FliD [Cereibacter azotoformans]|uniref:flagellar filament capping protein FliD n=1 Tax=Cereibacter azotoformans TaxID=43057 RepID=UPI001EEAA21C|nr:flagellar filament capping protein FliD [Cereibacter azotoformans]ULB09855.1 flagellar filament capping protein FliD [Cereibacter azotoformans]